MNYKSIIKPSIDFGLSFFALVILSPILLLLTLLLTITNNGSAFFVQLRPGKDSRIFKLIKFKTMNNRSDDEGILLSDVERLTSVGKFIRKTSLDEIPQLLNVIKGEMSLVGPRPLLVEYLSLYNKEQAHRHEVRPGITGWAQVNGRNSITWEEKFKLDIWYVENMTFLLDLKILLTTVHKVVTGKGINSSSSNTMEQFKGENK